MVFTGTCDSRKNLRALTPFEKEGVRAREDVDEGGNGERDRARVTWMGEKNKEEKEKEHQKRRKREKLERVGG